MENPKLRYASRSTSLHLEVDEVQHIWFGCKMGRRGAKKELILEGCSVLQLASYKLRQMGCVHALHKTPGQISSELEQASFSVGSSLLVGGLWTISCMMSC